MPAVIAAGTILLYVLVYTPLKRRSTLNTVLGPICGALPPLIGWSAATGGLDTGAWLLFTLLFVWQMPHFLSLAWMYRDDYALGGFRMLPVEDEEGGRLVGDADTEAVASVSFQSIPARALNRCGAAEPSVTAPTSRPTRKPMSARAQVVTIFMLTG